MANIPLIDKNDGLKCLKDGCEEPVTQAFITVQESGAIILKHICAAGHHTRLDLEVKQKKVIEPAAVSYKMKASGVTFSNADGTNRQTLLKHVKAGDLLRVEKGDSPAGGIMYMLKHDLGYIGSIKSATLREYMATNPNKPFIVKVLQLTGGTGEKSTIGCNIELSAAKDGAGQSMEELLAGDTGAKKGVIARNPAVYIDPTKKVYHTEEHCSGMKNAERTTLQNALYRFKARPCKKCGAATLLGRKD